MANETATAPNSPLFVRLTPLFAALLAAIGALVAASVRGFSLPFDVAGVFLVIGIAASWIARRTPFVGAIFVVVLAVVVIGVVYGG